MPFLLIAFACAFVATLLIVRSSSHHAHLSGDTDRDGPQKFHAVVVPRIGGIGIAAGLSAAAFAAWQHVDHDRNTLLALGVGSSLAFAAGLLEDFTKRVSPLMRMLAMVVAAGLALAMGGGEILKTDISLLDAMMGVTGFSVALTLFTVAGVSNSINIIDGFNGLASMCVAIMLAVVAYVAFQVGDTLVFDCALAGIGAALGFFCWNYPFGRVFLGDGGAYLLGFWVAELSILLVQRNALVSPMFPLLLCIYPVFETVFSMYRRKFVRGRPVGQPDATHLHSLIYRRLMRWAVGRHDPETMLRRNSMTSPYLWVLCSIAAIPALIWWNDSNALQWMIALFCFTYIALYRSIVRFQTPRMLVRKRSIPQVLESAG
ncbi:MAG: glycosyltransferase [Leptothrix sp. (in: b-proteobacteria)]